MVSVSPKVKKWIDEKRDPRSAHYQAGLESILDLFLPDLEKGRIIPVREMDERDVHLFKLALGKVDVSPAIYAAFLSQAIADAIVPPDSAEEVLRIEKGKPSCKIIILRPGQEDRLMCAEISDQAYKPGIDIFQSGALLGTYDYTNTEDCLDGLNKAVKAHAWKKDTWQKQDYLTYTLDWFERVQYLGTAEVSVDKNFSFFHSPTLIKTNRVDGLFQLLFLLLNRQYTAPGYLESNPELAEKIKNRDSDFCRAIAQDHILDLLNLIKNLDLMDFAGFSNSENKDFQNEFARTEEKLRDRLIHLNFKKGE
ncbi:MAG: hypothetical protein K8R67_02035 [Desulfobacteraceae bacterium]|nr:hypothetical protein [Desulfobacteraceae bacterium]